MVKIGVLKFFYLSLAAIFFTSCAGQLAIQAPIETDTLLAVTSTLTPTKTNTAASTPKSIPVQLTTLTPWALEAQEDLTYLLPQLRDTSGEVDYTEAFERQSPDAQWKTIVTLTEEEIGGEFYRYIRLDLASADGKVRLTPYEFTGKLGSGGFPVPILWPEVEGKFIFALSPFSEGCRAFGRYEQLTSVDITTGRVTAIGPSWIGDYALSPDRNFLAMAPNVWNKEPSSFAISVLSTKDGSYQTMQLDIAQIEEAGGFVWAPNSASFVFTAAKSPCRGNSGEEEYAIYRVDLANLEVRLLLDFNPEIKQAVEWNEDGLVLETKYADSRWFMDPNTGEHYKFD